jgi:dihydrofolate synthase/folylpolyglutamate synthase
MNYNEAINFLFEQLPMYQRTGPAAYKDSLDNTLALDDYFNHPHKKFKTIHVAGTNGKGSVSHLLASILQEAGYRTGLYTSPHLLDFRERIKINGQMISEEQVVSFVTESKEIIEKIKPSFFEMTVAMAFNHFAESKVDIAVIETGLGGRLDSTNIITPELSIITNIGYDHTNLLGDSLEKIAAEKAGIIKPYIPVLIGELQEDIFHVFYYKSKEKEAPLFVADEIYFTELKSVFEDYKLIDVYKGHEFYISGLYLPLMGNYQHKNIQTILKATDILKDIGILIDNDSILNGIKNVIKNTDLKGRWQKLSSKPLIICDTGHNEDGIKEVVSQLSKTKYEQLHIVFGVVNDKDLTGILKILPQNAIYYFTRADIPRSLPAQVLKENAALFGLTGDAFDTVKEAIEAAKKKATDDDLIFIGGSTFVVAEAL